MKRLVMPVLLALVLLSGVIGAGRIQAGSPAQSLLVYVSFPVSGSRPALPDTGITVYAYVSDADGGGLLAGVDRSVLEALAALDLSYQVLEDAPTETDADGYYIANTMPGREEPTWASFGDIVYAGPGWWLMRMTPESALRLVAAGAELQRVMSDPKPAIPAAPAAREDIIFDPAVQAMMDQVLSETVSLYDGGLSGEWPVTIGGDPYTIATRYTYSGEPIQKATEYVGQHFADLGLDVEYHQWNGSGYPNVIGEITGLTNPEEIYIISAHLDDMPSGSIAPGADDNASGVTAAMIAADILSQHEWGCTLRFGIWTGEEQGLLGSYYYAQQAYANGENIAGVLNLDMIGWNTPSSSRTIDLHANSSMPGTIELAQLFADVIDVYELDLIPGIVPNGSGASDHASFWQFGYDALMGIEDFDDFNPRYHTVNDRLQYLDLDYFTEFVRASVGSFVHMSDCLIATCEPVQILDVNTQSNECVVDFTPIYTGTAPISWEWSFQNGAPPTSTLESPTGIDFGVSGTYAYTATAANCGGTGLDTFVDAVTVSCESCTPIFAIELSQLSPDPIYPGEPVAFSADLMPDEANKPYSYTVSVDGAPILSGQSSDDPLEFQHSFTEPGEYTVSIDAWNCEMSEPATTELMVIVVAPACTALTEVDLELESDGDILPGDEVLFSADLSPDDAAKPYSYTVSVEGVPILSGQSSDDPLEFQHIFSDPGEYAVSIAAWNCEMGEPATDELLVIVVAPACIALTEVDLELESDDDVLPGDEVLFSADLSPDDAAKPYSYTVSVEGVPILSGQSSDDPLEFEHNFNEPGEYEVSIAVWNCGMPEPVTDTITVTVLAPVSRLYLPAVWRP